MSIWTFFFWMDDHMFQHTLCSLNTIIFWRNPKVLPQTKNFLSSFFDLRTTWALYTDREILDNSEILFSIYHTGPIDFLGIIIIIMLPIYKMVLFQFILFVYFGFLLFKSLWILILPAWTGVPAGNGWSCAGSLTNDWEGHVAIIY